MTQDEIICMAEEAGFTESKQFEGIWVVDQDEVNEFAALVAAHEREALAEPVCKRCNGTKLVSDGEIDNIGGVDLEVPIECVKDCPDCAQPVKQEPVAYLDNGTRFKVTLTDSDCYIKSLPRELGGRWVALVAAEDDRHLNATPADSKAIRAEALEEAEEIAKTIGGSFSVEFLAAIRKLKDAT